MAHDAPKKMPAILCQSYGHSLYLLLWVRKPVHSPPLFIEPFPPASRLSFPEVFLEQAFTTNICKSDPRRVRTGRPHAALSISSPAARNLLQRRCRRIRASKLPVSVRPKAFH